MQFQQNRCPHIVAVECFLVLKQRVQRDNDEELVVVVVVVAVAVGSDEEGDVEVVAVVAVLSIFDSFSILFVSSADL